MEKQKNHYQLKDQEHSPESRNNETDLFSLIDTEFKKEVMKILKVLRKNIERNADHCNKELENIKMNKSKLDNQLPR